MRFALLTLSGALLACETTVATVPAPNLAECVSASDCPAPAGPCAAATCISSSCQEAVLAPGSPCGDAGWQCDPAAICVECLVDGDCAAGSCLRGRCSIARCDDGVHNGAETDRDCGGPCDACANGAACDAHDDCQSGICGPEGDGGICRACREDSECADDGSARCRDGECIGIGANGAACSENRQCASGFCPADDGICCDLPCDGLCASCSAAANGGEDGVCAAVRQGTDPKNECRVSAGGCGLDACSGTIGQCAVAISGVPCRQAEGGCDSAETCDGVSTVCPADQHLDAGVVCRASEGTCDPDERCDGRSAGCPDDARESAGVICRAAAGACDLTETCDGRNIACPADQQQPVDTICRAAQGSCDPPETCDGRSALCPEDRIAAAQTVCRAAAGACDRAERCDGRTPNCPLNVLVGLNTPCREAAGSCDIRELCDGRSATCPADLFRPERSRCRSAQDRCDLEELCPGDDAACPADAKQVAGHTCRASVGSCDQAEVCDGRNNACPANIVAPQDTICRVSQGGCDPSEICDGRRTSCPGDAIHGAGVSCRAVAGACDIAEVCNGRSRACPQDSVLQDGAPSTAQACDPYLCAGDAQCPERCADNDDCAPGHVCADDVCALGIPRSCAGVLAAEPQSQSGNYDIDPDGAGGAAPYAVYCDMDHQGGGWTNLNFANNRILLQSGQFIDCSSGLTSTDSRVTCTDPLFSGNDRWLYLHRCDGGDDSPTYLLQEVAPEIGHRARPTLGFTGYQATQNGAEANPANAEYCYANGRIDRWDSNTCRPYRERNRNTSCAIGLIHWVR